MPGEVSHQFASRVRTAAYRSLVVVSLFNALSAVGGGIGMVGIVSWLPREIAAGHARPSEPPPSHKTMTKVPLL